MVRAERQERRQVPRIASAADVASRTYAVRVTIAHPLRNRLGMTTSVCFNVAQDIPPPIVPMTAFTEENGRTIAYVADRNRQIVSRREVSLDGVAEEGVKVKSGLVPGEIVVTGGVQFLKDGMSVRLPKEVLTAVAVQQRQRTLSSIIEEGGDHGRRHETTRTVASTSRDGRSSIPTSPAFCSC